MSILKDRMEAIYKERDATHMDDWLKTEETWKKEIEILCENMDETVRYLKEECTAAGFSWISEVMEDVAERTQSLEFVEALYQVAKKYPEEVKKYNIMSFIDGSKDTLKQFWE